MAREQKILELQARQNQMKLDEERRQKELQRKREEEDAKAHVSRSLAREVS